jgi:predicted porin
MQKLNKLMLGVVSSTTIVSMAYGNNSFTSELNHYKNLVNDTTLPKKFIQGDRVKIESCDKYQWCKLKDKNLYVKGFYFTKFKNNTYEKVSNKVTYLYTKQQNSDLLKYIKKNFTLSNQESLWLNDNYRYTYLRVMEKEEYDKIICQIQEKPAPSNKKQANNHTANTSEKKQEIKDIKKDEDYYFVYGALGQTYISIGNSGTEVRNSEFDLDGSAHEVGVGYKFNKNFFTTLATQESSFDNVKIKNTILTGNFQFQLTKFLELINLKEIFTPLSFIPIEQMKPFVGVIVSKSNLDWQKKPSENITTQQTTSSKQQFGFQGGMDYDMQKNITLFVKYQYFLGKHSTKINDDEISFQNQNNIFIGVRYNIY